MMCRQKVICLLKEFSSLFAGLYCTEIERSHSNSGTPGGITKEAISGKTKTGDKDERAGQDDLPFFALPAASEGKTAKRGALLLLPSQSAGQKMPLRKKTMAKNLSDICAIHNVKYCEPIFLEPPCELYLETTASVERFPISLNSL